MNVGIGDFRGGQSLLRRIPADASARMSKINGFDCASGPLIPQGLVAKLNENAAIDASIPPQTPVAWRSPHGIHVICRDAEGYVWELKRNLWEKSTARIPASLHGVPARTPEGVILPTDDGQLWFYEPHSSVTKARPLSLKGPCDYKGSEKPSVTPSAMAGVLLFDCEDGDDWAAPGTGCSADITSTDTAVLTATSTTPVSHKCFTKSLGSTGIALTGKVYLVMDLMVTGDLAEYAKGGLFLNDPNIYPSGYELRLYDNVGCTGTGFKTLTIPALTPLGQVSRVVFHLGALTSTVKGVAITTASYWTAPAAGESRILTVWSEDFEDDWTQKSAFLMPEVVFLKSPWHDLTEVTDPSQSTKTALQAVTSPTRTMGIGGSQTGRVVLPPSGTTGTSAMVLQRFPVTGAGMLPMMPKVRYRYCFCGRDALTKPLWVPMISNPSQSSVEHGADPWRTYPVAITLPGYLATVMDEYGDYITHALIYRQLYDGDNSTWGAWTFVAAEPIAASITYTDGGNDGLPLVDGAEVPVELELANDYGSACRYAVISQGCVWAGYLDGTRRVAIMRSSEGKFWAYPTTTDENSLVTDGTLLDDYGQTGMEMRGLLARNDDVYVWLDNEFFVCRGTDPISGYRFIRLDGVGTVSDRSIADCGRYGIVWNDGDDFYAYRAGLTEPVGRDRVDSHLIDWTQPHNAVYNGDRYILFCHYDGAPSLLILDLRHGGWRIRTSEALGLIGICVADTSGPVYGVTMNGDAVSLFGGAEDYGADSALVEVETGYLRVAGPGADTNIPEALLEIISDDPNGTEVTLTVTVQGFAQATQTKVVTVTPGRTRYQEGLNLKGEVVKLALAYTGATPPEIHYLGVKVEGELR